MAQKLWEICRDAKDAAHITNQHIADVTGLSLNAVAQYLRGDTKNSSVYTVGPICRACGVDLNAYFGIMLDADGKPDEERLRMELAHSEQLCWIYKKVAYCFGVIVLMALIALLIDLTNPSVGWVRA